MMPRPPFLSVQRWCALCLLALSLSVGGSAQAQSYEPQVLDRVYCDNIELGHPDLERCEAFLEELVAEEELLNEMVAEPRLIAAERRDEAPEREPSYRVFKAAAIIVVIPAGGVGGYLGGVALCRGSWSCYSSPESSLGAFFGLVTGIVLAGKILKIGESSDAQVSLSPYRHDDASGLMFSGQF